MPGQWPHSQLPSFQHPPSFARSGSEWLQARLHTTTQLKRWTLYILVPCLYLWSSRARVYQTACMLQHCQHPLKHTLSYFMHSTDCSHNRSRTRQSTFLLPMLCNHDHSAAWQACCTFANMQTHLRSWMSSDSAGKDRVCATIGLQAFAYFSAVSGRCNSLPCAECVCVGSSAVTVPSG